MKKALYIVFGISLVVTSCSQKFDMDINAVEPTKKRTAVRVIGPVIWSEDAPVIFYDGHFKFYHIDPRTNERFNNYNVEDFLLKKIQEKDRNIFIYSGWLRDTLVVYNDSIRYRNLYIFPLAKKFFLLKGKKIKILKYPYDVQQVVDAGFKNMYINDSLGIIIEKGASLSSGIVEYDEGLKELNLQIVKDTVFTKFEF